MLKKGNRNVWLIILIIFIGLILGSFIGDFLGNQFQNIELFKQKYTIGNTSPLVLDLKVISLTFGISVNLNFMSIICVILAIILYRKYWE
ncbi:protein of unknown function [Clostridium cavendishii DSM 21758]|uniref:DUF4321 domain-containing protein n=1 Tax=Clostridium cavendishii DSM 21758 TaxID=1121302 RepID=A0A1M6BLB1_9CLOT|nr:DUF4321 domain-containing protein [Clostridium cavendishii]SHI49447.1 protein of unknown function [Clostridium cavendishii DSM 21758]